MRLNVRPSFAALNQRGRYGFREPSVSVDHLVVGGGVVGLAIAAKLVKMYPNRSTVVVERHSKAGQETSSRNSEVIHAGKVVVLHVVLPTLPHSQVFIILLHR